MAAGYPIPFGKYLLTDLIAMGGMAEIYRAKIFGVNGFEKQMVVKRILPKYAQNPSFVQMFVDEAKILVSLTHGNIVPVYELGEVGGNYYIAMEYAEGITVLDVLRECYLKAKALTVAQCLYIAAEVAKGLGYAHSRTDPATGTPLGIVHRDLNPRNIVISPAGEVKILDFGIARSSQKKHQTGSGIIKGTPGYMAPEQVMGFSVDQRADQYGLAIIVHELLTVRRLLSVKDATEHRTLLQSRPFDNPSHFRGEISDGVDKVVMKALAMKPEDRYASTLDFEDSLRSEIAKMGAHVTSRQLAAAIADIKASPNAEGPPPEMTRRNTGSVKAVPPPSQPAAPPPPANPPPVPQEARQPQPPPIPQHSGPLPAVQDDFKMVEAPKPAPAPLPPSLPVATMSQRPSTQILAMNAGVDWANQIGADAEILALAKASGMRSNAPQKALLGAVAGVLVMVGLWAAFNPDEVRAMIKRATSGKPTVVGAIVFKSRPSGATVELDGKVVGKTNMRVDQVEIDGTHSVVLKFDDGRTFERTVNVGDFTSERKLEIMWDTNAAPDGGKP